MATIIALIHGEAGAYGIGFPDFPGAVSGGATIDEALRRGRETLATHIEALGEAGQDLPRVRTVDEVRADPALAEDFADAVLVTAVTVDLPGKAVRLNISMDEHLVARIDEAARARGESRSRFLAEAARTRLAG
ncbi:Predicted nuclease of the RNAse H fold, HicB family [Pseudoxanthobacter soli DSM 19599]|uniref:Predicted nuclease of the RNAse H fold, HicB family n=1 Tax=Pseudoxanthobacter soli DSM 19599 TaxID=1123029 RepID=A0A1M7ZLQ3_9HYPH|nr:type II toxin-antitoxin system HicB family antitoxin [Pseudoxanthobacter soli]SHO65833.1 Predicted nuclease of the RNAse H fold, HicB family [Pseudoxanthobacter soli DSM 19599]